MPESCAGRCKRNCTAKAFCMCTHTHSLTRACAHTHTHKHAHTNTHKHTHTNTHTRTHARTHTQLPLPEFYAGLRERNWTAKAFYKPAAPAWRVQLFRCGYEHVTGWHGLRAVVTEAGVGGAEGRRFWVDMPHSGVRVRLDEQAVTDPGSLGYNAVLAQLYQAYEQRLTKAAKKELDQKGYLTPGG